MPASTSPNWKKQLASVLAVARLIFHWSYIPFVLYLGFRHGADPGTPPLHPLNLLTF